MRTRFDRCLVKSHNLHCCDHFGAQGIWATAMNPCVAELATGFLVLGIRGNYSSNTEEAVTRFDLAGYWQVSFVFKTAAVLAHF